LTCTPRPECPLYLSPPPPPSTPVPYTTLFRSPHQSRKKQTQCRLGHLSAHTSQQANINKPGQHRSGLLAMAGLHSSLSTCFASTPEIQQERPYQSPSG